MENKEKSVLEIILPEGTLEWFDVLEGHKDAENLYIVLQEKNIPPLTEKDKNKKIVAADFKEITITDFPIRGRRTLLTFKRRYWKVEGQKEFLKRDIKLCFPGTQLEKEFADFLKEDGGRGTLLAGFYRKVSAPPGERI
jgi:hypothetical protein